MIEKHIIELNEEDPNYRNKEERRHESLNVIFQLKQNTPTKSEKCRTPFQSEFISISKCQLTFKTPIV